MPPAARKTDAETKKRNPPKRKLLPARSNGRHPGGRPTRYSTDLANKICRLVASGLTLKETCAELKIPERTAYAWLLDHEEFLQSYERARDIRAGTAFPEQMLDIADNTSTDWSYNRESGKLC